MRRPAALLTIFAVLMGLGVAAPPTVAPAGAGSTTGPCPGPVPAGDPHTQAIEVYGAPGSFSALACEARATASGDPFEIREWDPVASGDDYPAGSSTWFTHIAEDGTVFAGTMQQTQNQFSTTSSGAGIARLDPDTGEFEYYDLPGTEPSDVSDLQATDDDEMAFVVARKNETGTDRPQFGKIVQELDGDWVYEDLAERTSVEFCGQINCNAPGEMAQLADGNLVSAAYFHPPGSTTIRSGSLIVTDSDGDHITTFQLANPSNGAISSVLPKGIEAAVTTLPSGASRFVVTYDFVHTGSARSSIQVFEYRPSTQTVVPVTAPILGPAGTYGSSTYPSRVGYGAGMFDQSGDLWASGSTGSVDGSVGGPLVRFTATSPVFGSGSPCPYVVDVNGKVDYQMECAPTTAVSDTATIAPMWDIAHSGDSADPNLYALSPFGGVVVPVDRTSTSTTPSTFQVTRPPVVLGRTMLNRDTFTKPTGYTSAATNPFPNDGDIHDGILWLSLATIPGQKTVVPPLQDTAFPQYLVRIDLAKLRTGGPFGTASLGGAAGAPTSAPMGFVEQVLRNLRGGAHPTTTEINAFSARLLRGTKTDPAKPDAYTSPAQLALEVWCAASATAVPSATPPTTDACGTNPADNGRDGRMRWITRLYRAAFERWPTAGDLDWWNTHNTTWTQNQTGAHFAGSTEFLANYGSLSNEDFVEQLYLNVLGRAGEPSGVAYWTGQLDTGARTRGQVLYSFSATPEFKTNTLAEVRWILFPWRWDGSTPTDDQRDLYVQAEADGYGVNNIAGVIIGR